MARMQWDVCACLVLETGRTQEGDRSPKVTRFLPPAHQGALVAGLCCRTFVGNYGCSYEHLRKFLRRRQRASVILGKTK
jgi:hypothetical protein